MAVVTVVGASGLTVQVTVSGGQAESLASSFSASIQNAMTSSSLTSVGLMPGGNSSMTGASGTVEGIVTIGGTYSVSGDYNALVVGSSDTSGAASGTAFVNATGVTGSSIDVLAAASEGTVFLAGNQSGTFAAMTANNIFVGGNTTGDWTIATSGGNDTIYGTGGIDHIADNGGSNLIYLGDGTNYVTSSGQDTIDGAKGIDSVNMSGSHSMVSLGDNGFVSDTGSGNTISVGNSGVVAAGSNDTISAAGNLQVIHGDASDISVSGSMSFLNGTGNSTITAGNATIFGASGLNLMLDSTSGYSLFVADGTNETVNGASSLHAFQAFANSGDITMIGGSGYDTLVGGSGSDTMTGGSGGALFAITNGHAGGNYTITDFGSAAGDLVALYQYGLQNNNGLQSVLNSASVSGGNTTIQLADNSKITFVGVTDLKASDFTLS